MIKAVDKLFDPASCCGCLACVDVCPKGVLEQAVDDDGFYIPKIAHIDACVDCGLCIRTCKTHNTRQSASTFGNPEAFIAVGLESKATKRSSSGGMFWTLAKAFVQEADGLAYGAGFNDELIVCHSYASDFKTLTKFQGSKYVQSNTNGVFAQIKEFLQNGKRVLFSGTPCQVNALKLFIPERLQANLFLIDLVCHGVASPLLLSKYIQAIEATEHRTVKQVKFRWKNPLTRSGSSFYMMMMMMNRGASVIGHKDNDAYMKSYLDGVCFRESCYTCPFASQRRVGDITIGDCDSRREYPQFHKGEASSVFIINTARGQRMLEKYLKPHIDYMPIDLQKESEHNHQLSRPFAMPLGRTDFYNRIRKMSDIEFLAMYGHHKSFVNSMKQILLLYLPASFIQKVSKLLK